MRPVLSPEAEQAVLGALLVDPGSYDLISDQFDPTAFGVAAHRAIAEAMIALIAKRIPIDPVMLIEELAKEGRAEVAPPEAVWGIARGVGTAANIAHYMHIVLDLRAMREARRAVSELLNDDTTESADQLVAKAAKALGAIETGSYKEPLQLHSMMQRLSDDLEAEYLRKPGTEVISTGFASLDAVVGGFEPGIVQLYAARPSVGKSSLAVAFARSLASAGVPVGVYWLEDTARKFATRVAAAESGIPGLILRHGKMMRPEHWEKLTAAMERTKTWPLYVEDTKGLTGPQLVARMRRIRREKGVRVFIADHLGEVRLDLDSGDGRRDEALGDVARMFRDTIDSIGAGGCLFHQLGKRADEGGTPKLGWLFNSDVIGQVARVVGFLSAHAKTLEVYFAKCNYGPGGVKVELGWESDTMSVFEPRSES